MADIDTILGRIEALKEKQLSLIKAQFDTRRSILAKRLEALENARDSLAVRVAELFTEAPSTTLPQIPVTETPTRPPSSGVVTPPVEGLPKLPTTGTIKVLLVVDATEKLKTVVDALDVVLDGFKETKTPNKFGLVEFTDVKPGVHRIMVKDPLAPNPEVTFSVLAGRTSNVLVSLGRGPGKGFIQVVDELPLDELRSLPFGKEPIPIEEITTEDSPQEKKKEPEPAPEEKKPAPKPTPSKSPTPSDNKTSSTVSKAVNAGLKIALAGNPAANTIAKAAKVVAEKAAPAVKKAVKAVSGFIKKLTRR